MKNKSCTRQSLPFALGPRGELWGSLKVRAHRNMFVLQEALATRRSNKTRYIGLHGICCCPEEMEAACVPERLKTERKLHQQHSAESIRSLDTWARWAALVDSTLCTCHLSLQGGGSTVHWRAWKGSVLRPPNSALYGFYLVILFQIFPWNKSQPLTQQWICI